ncbi:hypothetical protein U9R62_10225 [Cylindrospermopsis raciborskii DSH]|uniref:hypothetical protein n=1 Tax=Cylindrospermopsis raciborskii TaxID=77022 RepID=UPI002EDA713B
MKLFQGDVNGFIDTVRRLFALLIGGTLPTMTWLIFEGYYASVLYAFLEFLNARASFPKISPTMVKADTTAILGDHIYDRN